MDGGDQLSKVACTGKLVGEINHIFQSVLAAINDFLLQYSFILDSGSSIHVSRLANSPVWSQTVGFLGTVLETRPYGLVSKWFGLKGFF